MDHDFLGHDLLDEEFAMARTKSRIHEMQTEKYLETPSYFSLHLDDSEGDEESDEEFPLHEE